MTQDERWQSKYNEVMDFMEKKHRRPSKFNDSERELRNWWKHQQKLLNAGELKPERIEKFKVLLAVGDKYKHVNQYQ